MSRFVFICFEIDSTRKHCKRWQMSQTHYNSCYLTIQSMYREEEREKIKIKRPQLSSIEIWLIAPYTFMSSKLHGIKLLFFALKNICTIPAAVRRSSSTEKALALAHAERTWADDFFYLRPKFTNNCLYCKHWNGNRLDLMILDYQVQKEADNIGDFFEMIKNKFWNSSFSEIKILIFIKSLILENQLFTTITLINVIDTTLPHPSNI